MKQFCNIAGANVFLFIALLRLYYNYPQHTLQQQTLLLI